jgi:hypothetical protein
LITEKSLSVLHFFKSIFLPFKIALLIRFGKIWGTLRTTYDDLLYSTWRSHKEECQVGSKSSHEYPVKWG